MGLKNGIEGIFNVLSIIGQTNKMKNDGTEIISYKNTYAALNDIRQRTEKRIFIFSSLVSLIFLCFYGYLIYLNIDVYSLRHIIIYSILAVLLVVSIFFNFVLNPMRKKRMSTEQKSKHSKRISVEKNIILLLTTITKIVSLGFMLYEIITIDSSIKRLIPFIISTIALIAQILVSYISRLLVDFYKTILVAIDEDIKSSGIVDALTNKNLIKEPISVATGVDNKSAEKIKEKLDNQIIVDNEVRAKNDKNQLFKISKYLIDNNPISIKDFNNKFKYSPNKTNEILDELKDLGIIKIKSKAIEVLISDVNKIKELIYQ